MKGKYASDTGQGWWKSLPSQRVAEIRHFEELELMLAQEIAADKCLNQRCCGRIQDRASSACSACDVGKKHNARKLLPKMQVALLPCPCSFSDPAGLSLRMLRRN